MSDAAHAPVYSIDSSSLMDWQARYYPADVFRTLIRNVDELVAKGRFIAPALVREEIKIVGTADLVTWTDARAAIFVPTADVLAEAQGI